MRVELTCIVAAVAMAAAQSVRSTEALAPVPPTYKKLRLILLTPRSGGGVATGRDAPRKVVGDVQRSEMTALHEQVDANTEYRSGVRELHGARALVRQGGRAISYVTTTRACRAHVRRCVARDHGVVRCDRLVRFDAGGATVDEFSLPSTRRGNRMWQNPEHHQSIRYARR